MNTTIADTLRTDESGLIARSFTGLVLGLLVTISLFWLMQNLIESTDGTLGEKSAGALLSFVRVEREEKILTEPDKIKRPPEPQPQPPRQRAPSMDEPSVISVTEIPSPDTIDHGPVIKGVFATEGDYLPIVKVAPIYPNRALQRGVEGSCVVEYTITTFGTIKDPLVVKDQCSSSLFYESSISAALKFKYKPRVVNGVEVEVSGVQNKFTYTIDG